MQLSEDDNENVPKLPSSAYLNERSSEFLDHFG